MTFVEDSTFKPRQVLEEKQYVLESSGDLVDTIMASPKMYGFREVPGGFVSDFCESNSNPSVTVCLRNEFGLFEDRAHLVAITLKREALVYVEKRGFKGIYTAKTIRPSTEIQYPLLAEDNQQ